VTYTLLGKKVYNNINFDISFKIVLDHFEDMCMEPFARGSMWKRYKITHISSYIKY
jgi:hypothetical protein